VGDIHISSDPPDQDRRYERREDKTKLTDPLGFPAVAPVKLEVLSPPNWEARSETRTPVRFVRTLRECVCLNCVWGGYVVCVVCK
jgi:hypothetical protein